MGKANPSTKRIQIDKSNAVIVGAVATAAFITIFSLIAVRALWSQSTYQRRVIHARETARDQIQENVKATDTLLTSYQSFVSSQQNVIGGNPTGQGEKDGDNARIVLDALPSKYDFPALTTSIEKLVKGQGLTIFELSGTDDEVNQAGSATNPQPQAIEMPFTVGVKGSYAGMQNLINVFEHSIRPFNVAKMTFKADQGTDLKLTLDVKSYYQPEKSLQFKSEVVK